jgi:hypothetical protein
MACNQEKPLRNGKEVPGQSRCYPGSLNGAKYGYYDAKSFWISKDALD